MVASAFDNVASMQGLRLENLRQRKEILRYHFAEVVFVLRTFGREDPQQNQTSRNKSLCSFVLIITIRFDSSSPLSLCSLAHNLLS
jgi:hypothetical protein